MNQELTSRSRIFNLLDAATDNKYGEIIDLLLEKENVAEFLTKRMVKDLLKEAATFKIKKPHSFYLKILGNILSVQNENYDEPEYFEGEYDSYSNEETDIPSTIAMTLNTKHSCITNLVNPSRQH